MMFPEIITIIGAGKVGTHIADAIRQSGLAINHVISRSASSAASLGKRMGCGYSTELTIPDETELVIVAVPDSSLTTVLAGVKAAEGMIIAHTAGSYGLEVFPGETNYRKGVIYPLQTFTAGRELKLASVPIFVEAQDQDTLNSIRELAGRIGKEVYNIDSLQRQKIHLAAVFVCNFVNHLYTAGDQIIRQTGLPYGILEPLITETLAKAMDIGPVAAQTGPALRNDRFTIEKHLDLLSFSPELRDIYRSVTDSIVKFYSAKANDQF